MTWSRWVPWVPLLVVACAGQPPSADGGRDLADEVRSEASGQNSVIEIFPLTDPAASELIRQARALEQQGRHELAAQRVGEALQISPNDPEYLQLLAELHLRRGDFPAAIESARTSYRLGPQLGQLCYRNWLTINRAWEAIGNPQQAADALASADACVVRERTKY